MKKLFLLFIFLYPVGETFNLNGFLHHCKIRGIILSADRKNSSPHGYVILGGGQLGVALYDESKPVATDLKGKALRPGNSVLPGDKFKYKLIIDAAVRDNQ